MNLELHIFTNSTVNAPSTFHIEETYKSFKNKFNIETIPFIWCDINPNIEKSNDYLQNLKKIFNNIKITNSLSDGYVQAIESSKSKFMFMLEHDWTFNHNLKNNINEILEEMEYNNIIHLRFNQFLNGKYWRDKEVKEIKGKHFNFCQTKWISNNPHIINKELYLSTMFNNILIQKGSFGVEQAISYKDYYGHIYGPLNLHATIGHLNGKKLKV